MADRVQGVGVTLQEEAQDSAAGADLAASVVEVLEVAEPEEAGRSFRTDSLSKKT